MSEETADSGNARETPCYLFDLIRAYYKEHPRAGNFKVFSDLIADCCSMWLFTLPMRTFIIPPAAAIAETVAKVNKAISDNNGIKPANLDKIFLDCLGKYIIRTSLNAGLPPKKILYTGNNCLFVCSIETLPDGKMVFRIGPIGENKEYTDMALTFVVSVVAESRNGSVLAILIDGSVSEPTVRTGPPGSDGLKPAGARTANRKPRRAAPPVQVGGARRRPARGPLVRRSFMERSVPDLSGGAEGGEEEEDNATDSAPVARDEIYSAYAENSQLNAGKNISGDLFGYLSKNHSDIASAVLPLLSNDADVNAELLLDWRSSKPDSSANSGAHPFVYLVPDRILSNFKNSEFYLRNDPMGLGNRQIQLSRLETSIDLASAISSIKSSLVGGSASSASDDGGLHIARLQARPSELLSILAASADISPSDISGGAQEEFDESTAAYITESRGNIQRHFENRDYNAAVSSMNNFYNSLIDNKRSVHVYPSKTESYLRGLTSDLRVLNKSLARFDLVRYVIAKEKMDNDLKMTGASHARLDLVIPGRSLEEVDRFLMSDHTDTAAHRVHRGSSAQPSPNFRLSILSGLAKSDAFGFIRPPNGHEFHPQQFDPSIHYDQTTLTL
jgi:hypothetical protein